MRSIWLLCVLAVQSIFSCDFCRCMFSVYDFKLESSAVASRVKELSELSYEQLCEKYKDNKLITIDSVAFKELRKKEVSVVWALNEKRYELSNVLDLMISFEFDSDEFWQCAFCFMDKCTYVQKELHKRKNRESFVKYLIEKIKEAVDKGGVLSVDSDDCKFQKAQLSKKQVEWIFNGIKSANRCLHETILSVAYGDNNCYVKASREIFLTKENILSICFFFSEEMTKNHEFELPIRLAHELNHYLDDVLGNQMAELPSVLNALKNEKMITETFSNFLSKHIGNARELANILGVFKVGDDLMLNPYSEAYYLMKNNKLVRLAHDEVEYDKNVLDGSCLVYDVFNIFKEMKDE